MRHRTQAFTLMELLIVIAIIGTLVAVLLPNLLGAQRRAYDAAASACANALMKAAGMYRIDHPNSAEVPGVHGLYGDSTINELYGTAGCANLPPGSLIQGAAALNGNYAFTVRHAQGQNTFLATPDGIRRRP